MPNEEYTIACLLTDKSRDDLVTSIPFIDSDNLSHISLFQFKCSEASQIDRALSWLSQITIPRRLECSDITAVENNIFLNVYDHGQMLRKASGELANFFYNNSTKIEPLSQINIDGLAAKKARLVEKYGIYWIFEYFHPHVTLCYNLKIKVEIDNIVIPPIIEIHEPMILKIDKDGRVLDKSPIS